MPPATPEAKGKRAKGKFGKDIEGQRPAGAFSAGSAKFCRFTADKSRVGSTTRNVEVLKDFVNETGKIIPARITGTAAGYQRPAV